MRPFGLAMLLPGLAFLAFMLLDANWTALSGALVSLGWSGLAAIALLHVPAILASGAAWWRVGRVGRLEARLPQYVRARWVRESVSLTLPFSQIGGLVAGMRVASLDGGTTLASALSLMADTILDFSALLAYLAIGTTALLLLARRSAMLPAVGACVAGMGLLVAVLVVARKPLAVFVDRAINGAIAKWAGAQADAGADGQPTLLGIISARGACLANGALHLGCWLFGAVEAWATLRLMGAHVSLVDALVIDSLASGLRTCGFMVPSGIGVQEGAYALVFAIFGLPVSTALAFSLAWRARDTLLGLPGLAVWHETERKAESNAPQILMASALTFLRRRTGSGTVVAAADDTAV